MKSVALVLVVASGCLISPVVPFGAGKSPEEAQHQRMAELMPPQLGGDAEWTGTVRVAKIRVWADDDYRAQNVAWQRSFGEELEYTNAVLTGMYGVRLEPEYHAWQHHAPADTLAQDLDELARQDSGDGVLVVVGLTSALSLVTATVDQLGVAQTPGRHLVVRGYPDVAERTAFAHMFKELRADERDALHEARRRHKMTAVLLHELAHNLGAPHEDTPDTLMNPILSDHAATFSDSARDIMRGAFDARLGGGAPVATESRQHPSLVIALGASGETAVDGRKLDANTLDAMLRAAFQRDHDTEVVIKMDASAPHGAAIDLLNRAKSAGLLQLSLVTNDP